MVVVVCTLEVGVDDDGTWGSVVVEVVGSKVVVVEDETTEVVLVVIGDVLVIPLLVEGGFEVTGVVVETGGSVVVDTL